MRPQDNKVTLARFFISLYVIGGLLFLCGNEVIRSSTIGGVVIAVWLCGVVFLGVALWRFFRSHE